MAHGTRTRLDPAERRSQLVGLGLRMLSTRPLDQVAIDEIATEAGISRGLLFHYFPTKRDFHLAVVQAAADDLYACTEPDPGLDPAERVRAGLEAYVDYVSANRDAYVALLRGAAGGDPALLEVLDATRARIAARILACLGLTGPVPPRLRLTARGWVAFSEEVTLDWMAAGDLDRPAVVALLDEALTALLTAAERQEDGRAGRPVAARGLTLSTST